jgi:hypothetical protein
MAKPSEIPTWATGGTIVTPSSGKRATGWVTGEKAPAQWFNWFMNRVGQWCTYLDGLPGEALNWTATQTFANTVLNGMLTLTAPAADSASLICTIPLTGTTSARLYNCGPSFAPGGQTLNGFLLTFNASYNGTKWMPDTNGSGCSAVRIGVYSTGIELFAAPSSAGAGWNTLPTYVQLRTDRGIAFGGLVAGVATTTSGSPSITVNNVGADANSIVLATMQGGTVDSGFVRVKRAYWSSGTTILIEGEGNAVTTGAKVGWFVINSPI